mmetsp:Transcript_3055/g.8299  ORF Transcript_3055/g.8299 Transcript_3055/m.8299 type:complete len:128 (+) Transcript_3055:1473-1856(+)
MIIWCIKSRKSILSLIWSKSRNQIRGVVQKDCGYFCDPSNFPAARISSPDELRNIDCVCLGLMQTKTRDRPAPEAETANAHTNSRLPGRNTSYFKSKPMIWHFPINTKAHWITVVIEQIHNNINLID